MNTTLLDVHPLTERHAVAKTTRKKVNYLFVFTMVAVVLGAQLALRFVITDKSFGFTDAGTDTVQTGIIQFEVDMFFYLSFIQQMTLPNTVFMDNAQTSEPTAKVYFNPFFLVVGRLSALLNLQPLHILHFISVLGSVLVIVAVYITAVNLNMTPRASYLATIFAAFASGFSEVMYQLRRFGIRLPTGTDYTYLDSQIFSTIFVHPYHTFALALLALNILLIIRIDSVQTKQVPLSVLLTTTALIGSSVHPYEGVMLLGTFGLYTILCLTLTYAQSPRSIQQALTHNRHRLIILGCLMVGIIPPSLYSLWTAAQPGFTSFSGAAINDLVKSRIEWIFGYGMVLIAVLIGAVIYIRELRQQNTPQTDSTELLAFRWLMVWALSVYIFLIVLNINQTKICNGAHLSMVIIAGYAWDRIWQWIDGFPSERRVFAYGVFAGLTFLFFPSALRQYTTQYAEPSTVPHDLFRALSDIQAESGQTRPLILSDQFTGSKLVGFAPVRTWVGQWSLSSDYMRRIDMIKENGLFPESSAERDYISRAEVRVTTTTLENFIRDEPVDYVLVENSAPAAELMPEVSSVRLVACYTQHCLYHKN